MEITQFPLIAEKTPDILKKLLVVINKANVDGSIANPTFLNAKRDLNYINEALQNDLGKVYLHSGKHADVPRKIYALDLSLGNSGHWVGKAKKLRKIKDNHPLKDAFLAYADEFLLLVEAIESLKNKVVRRQIQSEEERPDNYVPPIPTTAAAITAMNILKELTDPLVATYETNLILHFETLVNHRLANPRKRGEFVAHGMADMLMSMVGENWDSFTGNYRALKEDWSSTLSTKAHLDADYAQRMFIYKNVMKLATILERKGSAKHKILSGYVDAGGFWGEINFTFEDGSSFNVRNKVVSKYSIHGVAFLQFPTTFHDARLSDGKVMPGQPSEEQMIEIFAKQ